MFRSFSRDFGPVVREQIRNFKVKRRDDVGDVAAGVAENQRTTVIAFSHAEGAVVVGVSGTPSAPAIAAATHIFEQLKNALHWSLGLFPPPAHRTSLPAGFAERAGRRPASMSRNASSGWILTHLPSFIDVTRLSRTQRRTQAEVTPMRSANSDIVSNL